MGNLKPIDSALVKDVDYDLISPDTVGGEYIETIGAACENPDGYTSGSLFLGRENGVQHLYRATAAIAFGETIILDTNCVYTTVSGELEGKAEESEVTSLNEALANEVATTTQNGAHNFIYYDQSLVKNLNDTGSWVGNTYSINGGTITDNLDGTIVINGTFTQVSEFVFTTRFTGSGIVIPSGNYKTVGAVGGDDNPVAIKVSTTRNNAFYEYGIDTGNGLNFEVLSTDGTFGVRLNVYAKTYNNIILKPMVLKASDPSTEYTPYAMTNRELTEKVSQKTFDSAVVLTLNTAYTPTSDGYIVGECTRTAGNYVALLVNGVVVSTAIYASGTPNVNPFCSVFVRKGMTVQFGGVGANASFIPLK